ncbi:MAG TPA: hypothetical protein VIF83_09705 [Gemmatimonadaceae bacterium]|jgi:hypothetical protein
MHHRLRIAAILAATPLLALSPVAFPAHPEAGCVRGVVGSRYNQRLFVSLMRRKDRIAERYLDTYNVRRVKQSEVRPVNDPVLCARAATAYGKALHDDTEGRKVHVLRVGDRYIVMDPQLVVDAYHRAVTFDSTFSTPLALVAE